MGMVLKRTRGNAMVEFAMLLPLLVFIFGAIYQAAFLWEAKINTIISARNNAWVETEAVEWSVSFSGILAKISSLGDEFICKTKFPDPEVRKYTVFPMMKAFGFDGEITADITFSAVTRSYYTHNVYFYWVSQAAIVAFFGVDATLAACSGGGDAVIKMALEKMVKEAVEGAIGKIKNKITLMVAGKIFDKLKGALIYKLTNSFPGIGPFGADVLKSVPSNYGDYSDLSSFMTAFGKNLVNNLKHNLGGIIKDQITKQVGKLDLSELEDTFGSVINNYTNTVLSVQ